MLFSAYALELGPNEFVLAKEQALFQFPALAPAPFGGRKIPCQIRVTNQNLELEGTMKKMFRPEEKIWASLGLDQIKRNGRDPVVIRKGRVVSIQCIGENEPVEIVFSSEEKAVGVVRAIWDQLTGTTEIQRNLSNAGKAAVSLISGLAGAAGGLLSQASKAFDESRKTGNSSDSSSQPGQTTHSDRSSYPPGQGEYPKAGDVDSASGKTSGSRPFSAGRSSQPDFAGSSNADGMTEEKRQLYAQIRQLREAGLLSEEEYQAKCRILFSK